MKMRAAAQDLLGALRPTTHLSHARPNRPDRRARFQTAKLVLGWVSSCGLYGWGSSGSAVAEARRRENCARSSQLDSESG
jgi:hypothetical protein